MQQLIGLSYKSPTNILNESLSPLIGLLSLFVKSCWYLYLLLFCYPKCHLYLNLTLWTAQTQFYFFCLLVCFSNQTQTYFTRGHNSDTHLTFCNLKFLKFEFEWMTLKCDRRHNPAEGGGAWHGQIRRWMEQATTVMEAEKRKRNVLIITWSSRCGFQLQQ